MQHVQDPTDPTGVADLTPRGNSEVTRARTRKAHAAIELRREGADWEEVAQVLGFPTGRAALVATEKALEKDLQTEESRAFMRSLAGQRLDRMLKAMWPKAINPEHPEQYSALDRVRAIITDQRKLYGLDAPTEMVVHNPSAAELEKWVSAVVNQGAPELAEGDIFDIEIVDDGSVLNGEPDAVPPE